MRTQSWEDWAVTELEAFLAGLAREPDFDAPELRAYDTADLLILETAAAMSRDADGLSNIVTIGDRHGALTLGVVHALGVSGLRVQQDPLLAERALAANAARLGLDDRYTQGELGDELLAGARLVLMQLPRSLAELDEIAWNIARWADPEVIVLAGGRDKHMSRSMNEVLGRSFGEVSAGRGSRKARVLTARAPRSQSELGVPRFPVRGRDAELPFELAAFGATFGGATLDHGSRLLLRTLREQPPMVRPSRIVDVGCGNGALAVSAALIWPDAQVIATDQSSAAVRSTALTAEAADILVGELEASGAGQAGAKVRVQRADGTEGVAHDWADLVLLNPPFHTGATVHTGVAHRLIKAAARVVAPGGELRLVFNSGLGYRSVIEHAVGPTRQLARDRTFTVLAAARRA